jgi:hypothetical protein
VNGRLKRFTVPLAGGSALLAVVAVAQFGSLLDGSATTTFTTSQGLPSEQSHALHARADAIFESFNGTTRQRNASGALQAWALNGAMDDCMRAAGFPEWDWSSTRNIAPRTNALGPSVFFAKPLAHSYSNALRDMAEAVRAEQQLREEVLTPAEDAAVGACVEATPSTSDSVADAASTPKVVQELRSAWWAMLASLDEKFGDLARYSECFDSSAASRNLDVGADSWQAQLAVFAPRASQMPSDDDPELADGAPWLTFLDAESQLESADWQCRRDVYEDHLDEVDVAVSAFAQEHAAEIGDAEVAWRAIEAQAAELGFHGQPGSLD